MSQHNTFTSQARVDANRENALQSTGPKTEDGKRVSSKNAVKTALTGRTVLLPADDADRYEAHIHSFREEWAPEGQRETVLTQSLADNAWRLERIGSFEMAIYAADRAFLSNAHPDEPEPMRSALIELEIARINERELRNLALQEARLRRQRDRDTAELRYLQAERKRLVEERLELAAHALEQAKAEQKPFDPAELGFVFSTPEIKRFIVLQKAKRELANVQSPSSLTALRKKKIA